MKLLMRLSVVTLLFFTACKEGKTSKKTTEKETIDYAFFGEQITDKDAIDSNAMFDKFKGLKAGDTIAVKFASKINEVCSKKGCWMKLDLSDGKETMVRFKDYGFFMPLNANEKEVIVEGKAFVKETTVEELRHYAKDAGKSKEEIALITKPEFTYSFEAHGVLMKK